VWASSSLAAKEDNAIQRVAQFTVKRGKILGSHAKTIYATNVRRKVQGETLYFRKYPNRGMLAQTVGYSTQVRNRTGLEQSLNDYLTGTNTNLNTVLRTSLDRLKGVTITGNNVFLTVDPGAQRLAQNELGTQCGAVAALDPRTGKVLVLASSPTYNLNLADTRNFLPAVNRIRANCRPASPLLNRTTAGLYPPGSSFKVVTAAAALDTGLYTPQSEFYDPGYCI
jgi:peptidoglycan glycosyltransferase